MRRTHRAVGLGSIPGVVNIVVLRVGFGFGFVIVVVVVRKKTRPGVRQLEFGRRVQRKRPGRRDVNGFFSGPSRGFAARLFAHWFANREREW